jgi:hypothetical protein
MFEAPVAAWRAQAPRRADFSPQHSAEALGSYPSPSSLGAQRHRACEMPRGVKPPPCVDAPLRAKAPRPKAPRRADFSPQHSAEALGPYPSPSSLGALRHRACEMPRGVKPPPCVDAPLRAKAPHPKAPRRADFSPQHSAEALGPYPSPSPLGAQRHRACEMPHGIKPPPCADAPLRAKAPRPKAPRRADFSPQHFAEALGSYPSPSPLGAQRHRACEMPHGIKPPPCVDAPLRTKAPRPKAPRRADFSPQHSARALGSYPV